MGLFVREKPVVAPSHPNAKQATPVKRLWSVSFSASEKPHESWAKHVNVIAESITDAIGAVQEKYQNCKVWNVAHRGEVGIET